jgi:hypothetical protein
VITLCVVGIVALAIVGGLFVAVCIEAPVAPKNPSRTKSAPKRLGSPMQIPTGSIVCRDADGAPGPNGILDSKPFAAALVWLFTFGVCYLAGIEEGARVAASTSPRRSLSLATDIVLRAIQVFSI